MNITPIFSKEFHIQTLSKKRRSPAQKLADRWHEIKSKRIDQLGVFFKPFIPQHLLKKSKKGDLSRGRIFDKSTTFWTFFSQLMDSDGSCSMMVSKLRACFAIRSSIPISSSTGAYCRARKKLKEEEIQAVLDHTIKGLEKEDKKVFSGRRVVVVDGTGLTASDTKKNQKEWPQDSQQKEGCGFPSLRICACFSLRTGGVLSYRIGNKKSHELPLFRDQWDEVFQENDILLGDKMFSNYFDIAMLKKRKVDSVTTLRSIRRKPIKQAKSYKKLGGNDLLVIWKKPAWNKKAAYTREKWEELPETLIVRQIKISVQSNGFRTKSFYIITSLLDPIGHPANELAELYFRRWEVELNFKDLKTTMGMDELRCKTPDMVKKEVIMYFIVYNAMRWVISKAAQKHDKDPMRISFKGTLQDLRNWEALFNSPKLTAQDKRKLIAELYQGIARRIVPHRPNRQEPRCLKRRHKNYQLLTQPRSTMKEIKHRSTYRAKTA